MNKRYYWLRLKDDFFSSKRIKKLRKLAGGDTYTIIYLKLQLLSIKSDGIITHTGLEDDFSAELALDLDENVDDVRMTLTYLINTGLAETSDNINYFFPYAVENTGTDTASTIRSRECRARKKAAITQPSKETISPTSTKHIPLIDAYTDHKRYNGNYYSVWQRDEGKCVICGDSENLCVHHIDGFAEEKPDNNELNKMVLLCRKCHSQIHHGMIIPADILLAIGYCNANATLMQRLCNGEIEKEIEIEIEIEKEIDTEERKGKDKGKENPPFIDSDRERDELREKGLSIIREVGGL